jgi:hypothetical protein
MRRLFKHWQACRLAEMSSKRQVAPPPATTDQDMKWQYEYQTWPNISQPQPALRKPHHNQVMPEESTHFRDVDDFYPLHSECSQFASNAARCSDAAFTAARPRF